MKDKRQITACPLCGAGPSESFTTREMMFGSGERFSYARCGRCASMWLREDLGSMDRFYPDDYYSLKQPDSPSIADPKRHVARRVRSDALLRLPTSALARLGELKVLPPFYSWLSLAHASTSSRICDLGSGNGDLITRMARQGFRDLWAFDPYAESDRDEGFAHYRVGVVTDVPEGFDVIMLNHSFEHMSSPGHVLSEIRQRLSQRGVAIIRIPVADSHAASVYGPNWVGLDPPRHLFVPTREGMSLLARSSGFSIASVFYDSTLLQFKGSEFYSRDIPLTTAGKETNPQLHGIELGQLHDWARESRRLNRAGRGDTAGFVLSPLKT